MSKLRIAQVAPVIVPTPPGGTGGTERVVHDLTEALVARGHDVTLVAPSDSAAGGATLLSAAPSLRALEAAHGAVPPGVPGVLEAMQLDLVARARPGFDIVHWHGEFAHAPLLAAIGAVHLTTIHWRVDQLDRALFFAHFPELHVAAISRAQEAALPAVNRAGVVHHGIDAHRYEQGPGYKPGPGGTSAGHLAFIGRMTDQKRPDRAIAIARAAGRRILLAGGVDVGNPRYFARCVAPLLGPGVVHLGEIDDAGKQALLGHAAALLFPIDWPEPFGLVMIEAMACGTPVIAWNRGSVPEIVEDGVTGFIVETEEDAVAAVARCDTLDRARIRACFERRFTATRMADAYVAIYRTLLAQRRSA